MKMNKIVLSLAGVLAAAAFAPEASAVPVFARQTGMACSACHFNHFPLLNAFGRSFKASGYTLMGAQGKVEGEDLSIPDRLNMGVLVTAGWENMSKASVPAAAAGQNFSGWFVPTNGGELSIFFGGKVTENSGFLSELGLTGNGANAVAGTPNAVGVPSAKLLILPEVGNNTRVGVAAYSIGQDAASSFELLNTGASSIHRLMGKTGTNAGATGTEHIRAYSARQYVAPEASAAGLSLIAVNTDMGFLNISKYASAPPGTTKQGVSGLPGTYVRAAAFFNLAGFESAAGIQSWSGTQVLGVGSNTGTYLREEKATVVDFQMQGEVGGKGLGIYASYGRAPAVNVVPAGPVGVNGAAAPAAAGFNAGAAGLATKTSFNIAADYTVMPKTTLQAAYRNAKTPATAAGVLGSTQSDNAIMIGAAYELAMNQHLSLTYTAQSGSAWDNVATAVNNGVAGKNVTTVLLETLF